jgi:hypothetical protein
VGSFKTALAFADAMKTEKHLEVHRYLRAAFQRVTGYNKGGRLDSREALVWWEKNKEDLRKKDTDAPLAERGTKPTAP